MEPEAVKEKVGAGVATEVAEVWALDKDGLPRPYRELNAEIHAAAAAGYHVIRVRDVRGQRFIGAGLEGNVRLEIYGTAGNDLGVFMDGPTIEVFGSAEDQAGNTMNSGTIVIHGNAWDVTGLAARGGTIFVRGNGGYRVGIHMKEYKRQRPVVVYGGRAREFFGEYMAGGILVALGLDLRGGDGAKPAAGPAVGPNLASGIHGGCIYIRGAVPDYFLGVGATRRELDEHDRKVLEPILGEFCRRFGVPADLVWDTPFTKIVPSSSRPYGKYYCGKLV